MIGLWHDALDNLDDEILGNSSDDEQAANFWEINAALVVPCNCVLLSSPSSVCT